MIVQTEKSSIHVNKEHTDVETNRALLACELVKRSISSLSGVPVDLSRLSWLCTRLREDSIDQVIK
jgi:hypothetical protein